MLRAKRGICESNECPFECNSEESIIHTLRNCEVAYRLWCCLINPIYHSTFFSGNLQDWLKWNVKNKPATRRYTSWPWIEIFSIICWLIWKNRCKRVFEGAGEQPGTILQRFQHHLKEGVEEGRYKHQIYKIQGRSLATWQCPPEGFIRIDVDGSVTENNQAACGGIIRNSSGAWVGGFQQKIGFSCSTMAEIHAIKVGLQVCRSMRLKRVKMFSDSLEAIQLLSQEFGENHP